MPIAPGFSNDRLTLAANTISTPPLRNNPVSYNNIFFPFFIFTRFIPFFKSIFSEYAWRCGPQPKVFEAKYIINKYIKANSNFDQNYVKKRNEYVKSDKQ